MINIYVDESGSINNQLKNHDKFVVCLLKVNNPRSAKRLYKRFVSKNIKRLEELDKEKVDPKDCRVIKPGGKMFKNGKFNELKGSQFDKSMKLEFLKFFLENPPFEIFYVVMDNDKLSNAFCKNKARAFNYAIRLSIGFFIKKELLKDEDCFMQLDERNERTDAKYFLENYLNTELSLEDGLTCHMKVSYFDSSNNRLIQLADVFSNIMYSNLKTGAYQNEIQSMLDSGTIKYVFKFPKCQVDKASE